MATIRVQAVFQGGSGLPEDRFVNTFHFQNVLEAPEPYRTECEQLVIDFFTVETNNVSIGGFMSPYVNREFTVQSYNLVEPEGEREPQIQTATLGSTGSSFGLPEEVALCVSLSGTPEGPRRRGRLYIGPLNSNGLVTIGGDANTPARPDIVSSQSIGSVVRDRCVDLRGQTVPGNTWCIRSITPAENFVPITHGHIDDAWDTQRRRGPSASTRLEWST